VSEGEEAVESSEVVDVVVDVTVDDVVVVLEELELDVDDKVWLELDVEELVLEAMELEDGWGVSDELTDERGVWEVAVTEADDITKWEVGVVEGSLVVVADGVSAVEVEEAGEADGFSSGDVGVTAAAL
jgi:hypothetical protein